MAGKKDNTMVLVLTDMTDNQAAQMLKEVVKAKKKYAPNARGTAACGKRSDVGNLLQSGMREPSPGSRNDPRYGHRSR